MSCPPIRIRPSWTSVIRSSRRVSVVFPPPDRPTRPSLVPLGLVGRSGGGKTTLTRLLLRMTDVQEGRILIGGQDISKLRQSDLRSLIAYVPQAPALFHRTL